MGAGIILLAYGCGNSKTMTGTNTSTNAAIVVDVPADLQKSFITRYPNATKVEWSYYSEVPSPIEWDLTDWQMLNNKDYVVRYYVNEEPYYSWYDAHGNWIGSTYSISNFTSLPAPINTTFAAKYPGYTISSVNTELWKDRTAYEVTLKNSDRRVKVLIDANGNIIKEKIK